MVPFSYWRVLHYSTLIPLLIALAPTIGAYFLFVSEFISIGVIFFVSIDWLFMKTLQQRRINTISISIPFALCLHTDILPSSSSKMTNEVATMAHCTVLHPFLQWLTFSCAHFLCASAFSFCFYSIKSMQSFSHLYYYRRLRKVSICSGSSGHTQSLSST